MQPASPIPNAALQDQIPSLASAGHLSPDVRQTMPSGSKPFLCRRPVRVTIYAFLAVVLLLMLAWRYIPILLDPTFEKHMASKRVMVGMSRQQVLKTWGSPYTINVSYTKDGIRREEWIYEDWLSSSDIKHRYLHFEEDVLIGGWYYSPDPGNSSSASRPSFHDPNALKELSN